MEFNEYIDDWSCKNCGHDSHCGTPYHRLETDYNGASYQIKVCDHCRCNSCENKDIENGKRTF